MFARLQAVSAVTDLVGTRVFPAPLPQGQTLPAVTYQRVSGARESAMGSDTGVAHPRIQVDCWASSYSGVKALATAVRGALQRYSGTIATVEIQDSFLKNDIDLFEDEIEANRVMLDFEIWHRE